jgi:hypothetical protein
MSWIVANTTPYAYPEGTVGQQTYLWPGGVMTAEPMALETSYRTADGTRHTYNTAGGWNPWAFVWTFKRMPAEHMNALWKLWDVNHGTAFVAPVHLSLVPMLRDNGFDPLIYPVNSGGEFIVDITDQGIRASREIGPRMSFIGYSGSFRFEMVRNVDAQTKSLMYGGEPETEVVA